MSQELQALYNFLTSAHDTASGAYRNALEDGDMAVAQQLAIECRRIEEEFAAEFFCPITDCY